MAREEENDSSKEGRTKKRYKRKGRKVGDERGSGGKFT